MSIYTEAKLFCFRESGTQMMIILRITMKALPEKRKELKQTLLSLIEPTTKEKGCLRYEGFCDITDNTVFTLLVAWENHEDLEHHLKSERFGVLLGTKSLLRELQKIEIHTVSLSEELAPVRDHKSSVRHSIAAGRYTI